MLRLHWQIEVRRAKAVGRLKYNTKNYHKILNGQLPCFRSCYHGLFHRSICETHGSYFIHACEGLLLRGRSGSILPCLCLERIKYVNNYQNWISCKVSWVVEHVKASKQLFIYIIIIRAIPVGLLHSLAYEVNNVFLK